MQPTLAAKESSWRLLFDIALSHGESLKCQRLTYSGFLVFVESAALVGPSTGVFPALLEELWRRHCEPWSRAAERPSPRSVYGGSSARLAPPHVSETNVAAFREEAREHGVVNFDGFADIMNVISVRCFQTHNCQSLMHADTQQSLRDAIVLSAESRVRLVECVTYTAAEYLKDFVHRNTVHRETIIRLDPALNGWTPHVKALVSHLVGCLYRTLLLPLFHRFAPTGQMNRTEFVNFIRAVLPPLNAIEEASVMAIFDYRGFCHPNVYTKPLDDRAVSSSGKGETASAEGATPCTSRAESAGVRTIGFDAFVDAVLMLGVVVYADERLWPRHHCITAKLWSIFEDYLCRAVPSAVMATDPLFIASHASVPPVLSLVHPARLPVDRLSVVLLGGLNITVEGETAIDNNELAARVASAATEPDCAPGPHDVEHPSTRHSSVASSVPSEVPALQRAAPPLSPSATDDAASADPTASALPSTSLSVAQAAAALFDTAFERREFTSFDTPVYGQRHCHVYVNEEEASSEMLCPNLAAVHLPRSFWNTTTFRSYVSFVTSAGHDGGAALVFTPFRRVVVSLRHEDGVRVYTSAALVLEASPTSQKLSEDVVKTLEAVFREHRDASNVEDGDDGEPHSVPTTISTRAFTDICRQLHLVNAATATLHCQTAVQTYWRLAEESRAHSGTSDPLVTHGGVEETASPLPTSLSFAQFMCCIAHVCMKQANVTSAANLDILQYLSVALAASASPAAPPVDASNAPIAGSAAKSSVLPHNGLREVPYQQAVALRRRAAAEGDGRRTELLETLRGARSADTTQQGQPASAQTLIVDDDVLAQELAEVTAKMPMLPDFPSVLAADGPSGPNGGLPTPLYAPGFTRVGAASTLSSRLQSDFLRHEVVIKYP